MQRIKEWWEDSPTYKRIAAIWITVVSIAVIILGICFPIAGLIILALVLAIWTGIAIGMLTD